MRQLRYLPFLFLLALAACITNPVDTLNKRFAVFETGYQSAMIEVDKLQRSDSFKPETAKKVAQALQDTNQARALANTARKSGDILNANTALDLAIKALDKLKAELPAGTKL